MRRILVAILVSLLAITGLPAAVQAMEAAPSNASAEGSAGGVTLSWDNRDGISINVYRDQQGAGGVDCFATCLLYTSPSPRDATLSRMPSSA